MKLQAKILFVLLITNSVCFGQKPTSTDSLFQSIVENPRTELDKRIYTGGIINEFYELKNERNEWTAFNEFDSQGRIKEHGVYLNGYNFGVWRKYDSTGKVTSQIDYSIPKQLTGQNQIHLIEFSKVKDLGDSIIKTHFDSAFIKTIRLNAPRSYWYSKNNSGSWFEEAYEIPNKFTLRYSITIRDTLYFTPIEIQINNKKVISYSGIPDTNSFKLHIEYNEAFEIAKSNGYGQIHKTAFKDSEFMHLTFKDNNYYWVISRITKDKWEGYQDSNGGIITADGKTLRINALTGEATESEFGGLINVCD